MQNLASSTIVGTQILSTSIKDRLNPPTHTKSHHRKVEFKQSRFWTWGRNPLLLLSEKINPWGQPTYSCHRNSSRNSSARFYDGHWAHCSSPIKKNNSQKEHTLAALMFTHAENIFNSASQCPQPQIHNTRKYISHSTCNYQSANPSRPRRQLCPASWRHRFNVCTYHSHELHHFFKSKVP